MTTRIQRRNRRKILDAALDVFSAQGFRGATLDQIAAVAGLSKPNLLYYFDSKEAMHRALLDDLLDVGVSCSRIGNSSMQFQAGIFRDDHLLVSGELVYVFADPATQKSKPVPSALRDMLQSFEAGVSPIEIRVGHWSELGEQASALRREVFIDELGIGPGMDADAQDDGAVHALVRNRLGQPLATARLLQEGPAVARIARVAVSRTMRSTGFGRVVMEALMQLATERGDARVVLQSQCSAEGFYTHLGFAPIGEPYDEAGVPHIDMARRLGMA